MQTTRSRRRSLVILVALGVLLTLLVAPVGGQPAATGRVDVLIGFRQLPGAAEQALIRQHGGIVKRAYRLIPAVAASVPEGAFVALRRDPRVTVIEPDGTVEALGHTAELNNTWGVKRIGAGTVHDDPGTGFNKGTNVRVAVIDSGVDYTHAELSGRYAGGYDFVNNDADPMDDNGHGTHVAGTIAAALNGTGVVGAAPEARIYALKVLSAGGSGSWSNIIAALDWAVSSGIQVTNNSYGSSLSPGSLVEQAFANAEAAGMLHVAAAGNSGNCAGKGNNVGYPARYATVVAVAATGQDDKRACFSSTGSTVELAAPGVGINSTKLGGGYVQYNGTSMASPHVAGVAALVVYAAPTDLNGNGRINDEVRQILDSTATDLGQVGRDPQYGYGLVDAVAAVAGAATGGSGSGGSGGGSGTTVSVDSVTYATQGGKNGNQHLSITVSLKDNTGAAVSGASVSIALYRDGSQVGNATGTTGTDGTAKFVYNNAPSGCYSTTVTDVTAAGLTWDGNTPVKEYCK